MDTQVADGRIISQYGPAPLPFSEAVMRHWPYDVWSDAANLSYLESSWNSHATNDTRHLAGGQCNQRYYIERLGIWAQTEHSIGYFQINICAHGGTPDHWYDANNNAAKGAELYHQSGWVPWTYSAGKLGLL